MKNIRLELLVFIVILSILIMSFISCNGETYEDFEKDNQNDSVDSNGNGDDSNEEPGNGDDSNEEPGNGDDSNEEPSNGDVGNDIDDPDEEVDFEEGSKGLLYSYYDDGAYCKVFGIGQCTDDDIVIPQEVEGVPVKGIAYSAFSNCDNIKSIKIGKNITSIDSQAFSGCTNLSSVYINDLSVWFKIDFMDDSSNPLCYAENLYVNGELITDIIVPSNVTSIKSDAFSNYDKLTSINIPNGVVDIGARAFLNCKNLEKVKIGDSVTVIDGLAFGNCSKLSEIEIGTGIEQIGASAFLNCTSLINVNIKDLSRWCKITFAEYASNPLYFANNLILNETVVTEIVFDDGITKIKPYAFIGYNKLVRVVMGNSVIEIGKDAFRDCNNLLSLELGKNVELIDKKSFYLCRKLIEIINHSEINIAEVIDTDNVKEIHSGSTKIVNCDGFLFYTCDNTNYLVGYIGENQKLVLPTNYNGQGYEIYLWAFYGQKDIYDVEIPKGVSRIGSYAFYECNNLKNVVVGDDVNLIGVQAFYNCSRLENMVIGNSITTIWTSVASGCSEMNNIYYKGTFDEWNNIEISEWNEELMSAEVYYYSENEPLEEGNFWYYNENGEIIIWE